MSLSFGVEGLKLLKILRIVGLIKENLNVSYYFGGVKGIDCELLAKKNLQVSKNLKIDWQKNMDYLFTDKYKYPGNQNLSCPK